MSTLLDSLRRAKQTDPAAPRARDGGRQVEATLSTLGYSRRQGRMRVRPLAIGVAVALVALLGWMMWGGSGSTPLGTQVAADPALSPPETARPTEAVETAPSWMANGTPLSADDEVGRDAPATGPNDPVPVAAEYGGDALVPRLVDTDGDVVSAPVVPAGPPDQPPVPIIERGPVVTEVFAAALALQQAGDISGAVTGYQTLLADGARSAQVHNNLGLLYQEQNRFADAAREYERAIAIDPRHSKAHNNLGVVRMGQARYEDAVAAFRDARRLDGTNVGAWVNLALALEAAGDPAAARRTLVDALSIDARHAPTHYNLARLFELGGDARRAIEHYRRFIEHSGAEHADLVEIVRTRIATLSRSVRR